MRRITFVAAIAVCPGAMYASLAVRNANWLSPPSNTPAPS